MRIPRFKRSAVPAALVAAALLAASACGTTEKGAGDEETSAEAGPVSTVDFLGRTVELDKPAERVVILEWSEVEISISLGVMPVGVADIEGYNVWAGAAEPLDDSVTDVGMRSEASIDSIAGLNPDLVILENDNEAIIEPLEEFVPVLVTEGSNEEDNIARMQRDVDMIADLTGKNEEAEALWADFEAKVAETAAAIEAGGRTLAVVCSLMLAACAVAVAGPIGFVGLAAPVAARLIAQRLPGLLAHRVLIPFSALCGALVIVGADLALRATVDAEKSIYIPVGVTTTLLGAAVMVWLARSVRSAGSQDKPAILHGAANRGRVAYALIVTGLAAGAAATLFGGMLAGDTMLLGGDIFNWLAGKTGSSTSATRACSPRSSRVRRSRAPGR